MRVKRSKRSIQFTEEHQQFREMAKSFFKNEVQPNMEQWEKDGDVGKNIFLEAGKLGLICPNFPEEYGGSGVDFLYNVIVNEELSYTGNSGFFLPLHADVIAPYVLEFGTEEQKKKYLPGIIDGSNILSIAMTEPGTGSDLAAISTTAVEKSDHYVLNGQKTFISNAFIGNLCIVAARTGGPGIGGLSMFIVEDTYTGFERGRKLEKIGLHAQDTGELYFTDMMVPKENLLGKKNGGFRILMTELAQERLTLGISNLSAAEAVLDWTTDYIHQRKAFGKKIGQFQNTKFKMVDCYVEQEAARALTDKVIMNFVNGKKDKVEGSMIKLMNSELLNRHVDTCLQFFGGYGYMSEYPIAKAFIDARIQTIYAGTSEIMREIIGKNMGL